MMMMMRRDFTLLLLLLINIIIQSNYMSYSKSIVTTLPGYSGDLPFKLETGYVGIEDKEDVQLFYYFVESTKNPTKDPLIFHIPGGPGASALVHFFDGLGPMHLNWDTNRHNFIIEPNPNSWTQIANLIIVDIPAGTGFSYSDTEEGWISSDSILATQASDFIKKFIEDHPKFLRNPLYISGISYVGLIVPKIILQLYEGNEHGDQPAYNIQGYILTSPFTQKFMDFNSRFEYAYRMALISDDIYQSGKDSCHGNYVHTDPDNLICSNSIRSYKECTSHIKLENILEPFCDLNDPKQDCERDFNKVAHKWANNEAVQKALNIRQGKIENWEAINQTLHYYQGKNDTLFYSYDMFSSVSYHKKLSTKSCRALIISGDHDLTFPYVGVEKWITCLDLKVEVPWKPFYVDGQVGGYQTKHAKSSYSLAFATVKGAGHSVQRDKGKESLVLVQEWLSSQAYSSDL